MSHRAQQIVDAIAAELAANASLGASVFTNRVQSLSNPDQELPAVSVVYGTDTPLDDDGSSNFSFFDSLIVVQTIAFVSEEDEETALSKLLDLRRQIHITLMSDRSQGLSFVTNTRYQGADAPALDVTAGAVSGRLIVQWAVHYRMNISDPG